MKTQGILIIKGYQPSRNLGAESNKEILQFLGKINNILEQEGERISKFEYDTIKITQSENQEELKKKTEVRYGSVYL